MASERISLTPLIRLAAFALAGVAIVDSSWTAGREVPTPVRVEGASPVADDVREALKKALPERVDVESPAIPAAMVLVGDVPVIGMPPHGVPVSVVTPTAAERPNLGISQISSSPVMLAGVTGRLVTAVQATRAAGETSVITLMDGAIEVDRVEHTWQSGDESFAAGFDYVPAAPGVRSLRVTVTPLDGESTAADNHADVRVAVEDRKLRVLVYELRPSWATTFLRRALERDPIFEVAGLSRPSRGVDVRAGDAPERLRSPALEPFDAVIVGAPEELRQGELDALTWFARVRGGTFILVPDRRPSGAYPGIIPVASFEERLLERPAAADAAGTRLTAGEFAVAVKPGPAVQSLAVLEPGSGTAPVIFRWPVGAGSGAFVGALDAWRYRARDDYAAFWRAHVAAAAAESPRSVEAALTPGVVAPGGSVTLQVRIRATEIESHPQSIEYPRIAARLIRADGSIEPIRLWPDAASGVFNASFEAPAEGDHVVQVSSAGTTVDTPLVVKRDARAARPGAPASLEILAAASGGVLTSFGDLSPLTEHLRDLPRRTAAGAVHPARSPWWTGAFVALVCAEWALRRRKGLS